MRYSVGWLLLIILLGLLQSGIESPEKRTESLITVTLHDAPIQELVEEIEL